MSLGFSAGFHVQPLHSQMELQYSSLLMYSSRSLLELVSHPIEQYATIQELSRTTDLVCLFQNNCLCMSSTLTEFIQAPVTQRGLARLSVGFSGMVADVCPIFMEPQLRIKTKKTRVAATCTTGYQFRNAASISCPPVDFMRARSLLNICLTNLSSGCRSKEK